MSALDTFVDGMLFKPVKSTYGADFEHRERQLFVVSGVIYVQRRPCRVSVPCIVSPSIEPDAKLAVLHFHGTEGDINKSHVWFQLKRSGLAAHAINVEFPGYGMMAAGGITPADAHFHASEESVVAVAELVVEHLARAWGWSPQQIIFSGRSMGSGVATVMAKRHPEAAGLILLSGYSSLQQVAVDKLRWLPSFITRILVRERFGNLANVQSYFGPVMVLHGAKDTLIEVQHAQQMYDAARRAQRNSSQVVLHIDPEGTHSKVDAARALITFVNGLPIKPWYAPLRIPTARIADGGEDSIGVHAAEMHAAQRRCVQHFAAVRRNRFATVFVISVVTFYLLMRRRGGVASS